MFHSSRLRVPGNVPNAKHHQGPEAQDSDPKTTQDCRLACLSVLESRRTRNEACRSGHLVLKDHLGNFRYVLRSKCLESSVKLKHLGLGVWYVSSDMPAGPSCHSRRI